ncbi:MAG: BolA/IbaG family iron-sulfur metabolism protein [Alphaproteobacteria bacterium]|nr:BolA/IbaG family iron-sulfur metabolism protein [Alphaproteobacteria bacterium]
MSIARIIEGKVRQAFAPSHLAVINESHRHNVPPGSETHFKLVIVAQGFAAQSRVQRHQAVNRVLAEELRGGVHALSLQTMTPQEWTASRGSVLASPECRGGSKAARR